MNILGTNILFSLIKRSPLHNFHHYRTIAKVRLKWVKNRSLDHIIDVQTDLKAACLIKDAIACSSAGYLTSKSLLDSQKLLGLTVPTLRFVRRYPTLFEEYPHPKYPSLSCFKLTQLGKMLHEREIRVFKECEGDIIERLCRLLMMSRNKMGQDYIFVRAFIPVAASVLVKAWKESVDNSDIDLILGGMAALNDEVAWFKREASEWGVALDSVVPQKANLDYCRFLESLMSSDVDYTQAITAFWAIEAVYQESFAHCLEEDSKTPEELRETCQRWGNKGFGQYCQDLKIIANRQLEKASDDVLAKTEVSLLRVLEHEVKFWNMSSGGGVV